MATYRYTVGGTAADDQTWECTGTIDLKPGDFPDAPDMTMGEAFEKLTQGKAVFGQPGVGCRGPYRITKLLIEKEPT